MKVLTMIGRHVQATTRPRLLRAAEVCYVSDTRHATRDTRRMLTDSPRHAKTVTSDTIRHATRDTNVTGAIARLSKTVDSNAFVGVCVTRQSRLSKPKCIYIRDEWERVCVFRAPFARLSS